MHLGFAKRQDREDVRILACLQFGADTLFWDLDLSRLGDLHGLLWLVARALGAVLDLLDNVITLEDLAEDDVFAVQPGGDDGGDEELRAVLYIQSACCIPKSRSLHSQYPCQSWPWTTVPSWCAST